MNEQLKFLIGLQEIDTKILSVTEEIESLPQKLEKARFPMKETGVRFEKIKAEHAKLEKKKKEKYSVLDEIQEKINKLKARSSEIKTNKEYEAHLKEIKNFEDSRHQTEDEILTIMEDLEGLAKDSKNEEAKLKKAEDLCKQEEKKYEQEKNKLHAELEVYKAQRKDIARKIDGEIYERYMELIKNAGGVAVVQTRNEVCLGCNTNIPPQLYNDIKNNNDIFNCYYCNRFLYYSASAVSPESKQSE